MVEISAAEVLDHVSHRLSLLNLRSQHPDQSFERAALTLELTGNGEIADRLRQFALETKLESEFIEKLQKLGQDQRLAWPVRLAQEAVFKVTSNPDKMTRTSPFRGFWGLAQLPDLATDGYEGEFLRVKVGVFLTSRSVSPTISQHVLLKDAADGQFKLFKFDEEGFGNAFSVNDVEEGNSFHFRKKALPLAEGSLGQVFARFTDNLVREVVERSPRAVLDGFTAIFNEYRTSLLETASAQNRIEAAPAAQVLTLASPAAH